MGNNGVIAQDFDQRLCNIEKKLDSIAKTIAAIAVQDEKIVHLDRSLSKLWNKYDQGFGPEGIVPKIVQYQASCPRKEVEKLTVRVWGLIVSMLILAIGFIIKG